MNEILFAMVGCLAGIIIGYMAGSSLSRRANKPATPLPPQNECQPDLDPNKKIPYYEGIKLIREGKIMGLVEHRGAYSMISLDKAGEPGVFVLKEVRDGYKAKPFRRVTRADETGEFYPEHFPTEEENEQLVEQRVANIQLYPRDVPAELPPVYGVRIVSKLATKYPATEATKIYVSRLENDSYRRLFQLMAELRDAEI